MAQVDQKFPELKNLLADQNMMLGEMEKILVDASLAYNVGLKELNEEPFSVTADELADKLDQVKELYFSARTFLSKYDPDKLKTLEQNLCAQKEMLSQQVYHA